MIPWLPSIKAGIVALALLTGAPHGGSVQENHAAHATTRDTSFLTKSNTGSGQKRIGYWSGTKPPKVITRPQLQRGTHLSCRQVGRAWLEAGGSRTTEVLAEAEATAESDRWTGAVNQNPGSVDRGLFQMNSKWSARYSTGRVATNVRGAVVESNNGRDWSGWVSFDRGTEHGFCGLP